MRVCVVPALGFSTWKMPKMGVTQGAKSSCMVVILTYTLQPVLINLTLGPYVRVDDIPQGAGLAKHMTWAPTSMVPALVIIMLKSAKMSVVCSTKLICRVVIQTCTLHLEPIHLPLGPYVRVDDMPHPMELAKCIP